LKNANYLIMTAAILTISVVSMYFYDTYHWNYNDSVYLLDITDTEYNLKNPTARWDLPKELEEISGLSFYKKNKLACIQDEDGILYFYDLDRKEISKKIKFGEKGDYEGVEIINDTAYVLKSNGDIFYFDLANSENVEKIKTDLTKKNDSEGLGFHENIMGLLIACKENPGTKKVALEKSRSVYRVTIEDKKFKKKPKYIIDGKAYNKMLEEKGLSKKKHKPFKPSGVAVHPKTKDIFVIGTVGKMMIILNPEGDIKDLIPLDPKLFRQPEGICFSPKGDLYISSEGKGKKGYILKF